MRTATQYRTIYQLTDDEIEAAEVVCDELEDVLTTLGIALPSLWLDIGLSTPLDSDAPLVELGRCDLATARALTAALRVSADAGVTR